MFAVIIAALVLYYSHVVIDENIELLKENVEATFFPRDILPSRVFKRGTLRLSLIFYNKGDRMSVLKIDKILIPDHDLKSNKLELLHSISPHSHQLVKIDNQMLERDDYVETESLKIDSMVIEYFWTKKGKIKNVKETILVKCEIKKE